MKKNPNELHAKKAKELDAAIAIYDEAEAANRDVTEDEKTRIAEHKQQAEAYKAEADAIETEERKRFELAQEKASLVGLRNAGATARNAVGLEVSPNADIRVVKDRQIDGNDEWGFDGYGDFCQAVRRSEMKGQMWDERFSKIDVMLRRDFQLGPKSAYGQQTAVGEDGGFLVPPGYSTRIYERAMQVLPILGQCDRIILSGPGNSIKINGQVDHDRSSTTYRYGGVIVYWVAEAGEITRSSLKFRQVSLSLNKLAALSYCTEEELSDAFVNFGERLLGKHALGIADELVEALMFGTGVGKPQGAFASDACISTAKETGQAADSLVFENIVNMVANLDGNSLAGANWYYNGEALPQLATMSLAVGTGGVPVFLSTNGVAGAAPNTLWGRSAYPTEHCEALGDAGDICIGDFGQYLLATKGSIATAMSVHLRFIYDEAAFKSTFRVDGKPLWEQSLRPRKGATAKRVSPFVKLAERA